MIAALVSELSKEMLLSVEERAPNAVVPNRP